MEKCYQHWPFLKKLKFSSPKNVEVAVQAKAWMDTDLMLRWLRGVIVPYTKGRKALLVIDSFSAHETEELLEMARSNNIDIAIIPLFQVVAPARYSR